VLNVPQFPTRFASLRTINPYAEVILTHWSTLRTINPYGGAILTHWPTVRAITIDRVTMAHLLGYSTVLLNQDGKFNIDKSQSV